jgi:hypothetical protein
MTSPTLPPTHQRMFHGTIRAGALADQLCARFNDRQHRTRIEQHGDSALVQVGSKHGTPLTVHIADIAGGVMVSMSRDRDWLDRTADASEMLERAAGSLGSVLALVPDIIGELHSENLAPLVWDAINDLMSLSRSLAGEAHAPANPKVCPFCGTASPAELEQCPACGGPLPVVLPRVCPKCGRGHTSDALFCQACGTRLVEG